MTRYDVQAPCPCVACQDVAPEGCFAGYEDQELVPCLGAGCACVASDGECEGCWLWLK